MSDFYKAILPMLFEFEDYYYGLGSSILISTAESCYLITAKHVIENQQQRAENIRVYPSGGSRMSIPFDQLTRIDIDNEDPDYSDLYILRVDMDSFKKTGDGALISQRLEDGFLNPTLLQTGDQLIVVGYPEFGRQVDDQAYKIKSLLQSYNTRYVAISSSMMHCHEIQFDINHGLHSFNGLSGSPVYKQVEKKQMVVGILLKGTASSSIAFFLGVDVLRSAIIKAEKSKK